MTTRNDSVMHYSSFSLPLGVGLFLTSFFSAADGTVRDEQHNAGHDSKPSLLSQVRTPEDDSVPALLKVNVALKMEAFSLRNKKLRHSDKRENALELEPLARLRFSLLEGHPVYGVAEVELKDKTKRETGKPERNKTRLELTQIYLGLDADALDTHFRLGRWLYRDEREWLLDENIDGVLARWKSGRWRADVLGGRIDYWQRDLLDRTSRDAGKTTAMGAIVRRKLGSDWLAGAYALASENTHDAHYSQFHYGLRSHDERREGLRHWAEIGLMSGNKSGNRHSGFAADVGGTYVFASRLRPRLTLGYAYASKNYRQTGLQSNEATLGGNTKLNIYGATLAPELTNLHVITAGIGVDITPDASLDLIYHDYRQAQTADLEAHNGDLKSRYDNRSTTRLGSGIDLVWGVQVNKRLKTELIMGMFTPSKRFRSGASDNAPGSAPAYSIGFEAELRF